MEKWINHELYQTVEYKGLDGKVAEVLLYKWISFGTTDHPNQGHCWSQVPGKFRSTSDALRYAELIETKKELEYQLRKVRKELERTEREIEEISDRSKKPSPGPDKEVSSSKPDKEVSSPSHDADQDPEPGW